MSEAAAAEATTQTDETKPKQQRNRFRNNTHHTKSTSKDSVHVTYQTDVNQDLLRRVIFPENKWIKRWDVVVLVALFLLCFLLPYQIGVSGGHQIVVSIPWLVFTMFLNSIFFVDTFLYFFRAFIHPNTGVLIWHPQKIRRHYLRTYFIPNALSVLPFTLTFYILSKRAEETVNTVNSTIIVIKLGDIMKLFRLVRVRSIMASSNVVQEFRQRSNSQVLELYMYVVMIVMVSHWFACIWSLVALVESRGFNYLTERPNWIGNWVADNSVDGGLNPLGRANHIDRYFLSLFWSIQTLTSIGYGNIAPVTRTEWIVACLLQLVAGVMWAYVIGGLVGVAAGIQGRAAEYRGQADDANALIRQFEIDDSEDSGYCGDEMKQRHGKTARQIRRYVYKQYTTAETHASSTTLAQTFPVYEALSPQLQHNASWLIFHPYINSVPYLSSKYLSDKEQARVAMKCRVMYYGAGDTADFGGGGYNPIGVGIPVLAFGCVFCANVDREDLPYMKRFGVWTSARTPYGIGRALWDESNPHVETSRIRMHFASFAKIVFIPQEAVLEALERNKEAWRGCARWWYLRFILLHLASRTRSQGKVIMEGNF